MQRQTSKRSWTGDLTGGVTAALAALPVELIYGLFAVAPLGAAYTNHGLRAALWGCILGGVLGFLFRRTPGVLPGSLSSAALILGTLAVALLQQVEVRAAADPAALVFALLLLCSVLAGFFQLVFGLAKLGRALKYVPYPVLAGLMSGVGLLMFISALRPAFGIAHGTPWAEFFTNWHPLSLVVLAVTLALCFTVPRLTKRVPATLVALLGGTLLHHQLAAFAGVESLGATSGIIEGVVPTVSVWQTVFEQGGNLLGWLPMLIPYALAIAAFAAMETLLCLATIETSTHKAADADRELRHQGLANFLSGFLGATPHASIVSRAMINVSAGGHSAFSSLVYAATLTLIVLFAGHWLALLPNAVTAAILIYYAQSMVDDGTRHLARQLLTQRSTMENEQYQLLLANFGVIALVALVAVLGNMMQAIAVGAAAVMFIFVRSSMKPVIRRVFDAQFCRSLKVRTLQDIRILEREGAQIAVIEVEGPLFFGTADRVAREIKQVGKMSNALILDLKRVTDVDPTGARTLLQVAGNMAAEAHLLLLSGAPPRIEGLLRAMGLETVIAPEHWHADLDSALEEMEDALLLKLGAHAEQGIVPLAETALAHGLSAAQSQVLESYLYQHQYDSAGLLFAKGDPGSSVLLATGSVVDILIPLGNGRKKRVASFAPGVTFGEMALLEDMPRSADAFVQGPTLIWELSRERLTAIEQDHPDIARQVMLNISRILAQRLRVTTSELRLAIEG